MPRGSSLPWPGLRQKPRPRIPGRRIEPSQGMLETAVGPVLLVTNLGPLDLLPRLDPLGPFEALVNLSKEMTVAGRQILVIGVDALIFSKLHANRPKDRLALPVLIAETGPRRIVFRLDRPINKRSKLRESRPQGHGRQHDLAASETRSRTCAWRWSIRE
jgi:hypothetical protein